jgi:hypothetical protein
MHGRRALCRRIVLLTLVCAAPSATADSWSFLVEPYLSATTITGDAGVGRAAGVPVDLDFGSILENLAAAGMLHFEALHESGWGVWADYGFMKLEDDAKFARDGVIDLTLFQGILEVVGVRRIALEQGYLDLYGGVRWWDNELELEVSAAALPGTPSFEATEDWIDPTIGFRWHQPFSDRFGFNLRADMGGFGVGSDFTWKLFTTVSYDMSDRWGVEVGYAAIGVDYEDGSPGERGNFLYDTSPAVRMRAC